MSNNEMTEERKSLYQLCKQLGLNVSPNSSVETLTSKLLEYNTSLKSENISLKKQQHDNPIDKKSIDITYSKNIDPANRLVRCIVTCNNPDKATLDGEIITALNGSTTISKFVHFRKPYHVNQIILNALIEKKYTIGQTVKNPKTGFDEVQIDSYPEYSVELLPPLTLDEFNAIKQRQLARQAENHEQGEAY